MKKGILIGMRRLSLALSVIFIVGILTGCNSKKETEDYNSTAIAKSTVNDTTGINGQSGTSDSEANNTKTEFQDIIPNADTSWIKQKWLDVDYASLSNAQKLDIYVPNKGKGPFPVIIQIHGGAFKSGDKASCELTPALEGLKHGYAVAAVNYRLSREAKFPAQINDIKAAIRFLRANAEKYGLNPDKFAAWGGSAGGSLAALAGTSGDVVSLQDDKLGNAGISDRLQAVVDWYGPINFSTMDAEFSVLGITPVGTTSAASSPESAYLGKTVGSTEAEGIEKRASAETYITADDPPFFIQHGTADENIPVTQSANFSEKLRAVLGESKVFYEAIPDAIHIDYQFSTDENTKKVLNFLNKYLK